MPQNEADHRERSCEKKPAISVGIKMKCLSIFKKSRYTIHNAIHKNLQEYRRIDRQTAGRKNRTTDEAMIWKTNSPDCA